MSVMSDGELQLTESNHASLAQSVAGRLPAALDKAFDAAAIVPDVRVSDDVVTRRSVVRIRHEGDGARMETILTMTDFSRSAENAVERAASLAARFAAPMQLVYDEDHAGRERLSERLSRLAMRALQLECRWDIEVTRSAGAGGVVQGLQVVDRRRALSPDPAGDWPGLASRLGRLAAPMLVVRRASSQPYRTVLLPYGSRAEAERLQATAARWFEGSHWEWFQLAPDATAHEWPPPAGPAAPAAATRHSDYLSSRRTRRRFMRGAADPVALIVNQAQCSAADLVIVTAPSCGAGRRLLRRTFQERLARQLGCDLLVLPTHEAAAPRALADSAPRAGAAGQDETGADTVPVLLAWTDLSPGAEAMLEKAGGLAQAQGMRLRLGYCRATDAPFDAPLARLRQRARHLQRLYQIPVDVVEQEVRTLEALCHHLRHCALTCVAQASTYGDVDLLQKLLQLRAVPVLVCRSGGDVPYDRILVPVALAPRSAELVRWTRLGGPRAQIELLHVCEFPGAAIDARGSTAPLALDYYLALAAFEAQRRMQALLPAAWVQRSSQHLAHGDVLTQIAARQAQGGHALVIVGATRWPAWLEFFRPSLARRLCRMLATDVLVVPQAAPSWRTSWRNVPGSAP